MIYSSDNSLEHLSAAELQELKKEHRKYFTENGVLRDPVGYIFSSPLLTFTNSWETSLCTHLVDCGIDSAKFADVVSDIVYHRDEPLSKILYTAKDAGKKANIWAGWDKNYFTSFEVMCRVSNIPAVLGFSRLMRGWALSKIFDVPIRVGSAETKFLVNDMSKYTKTSLGYTMQSIISFVLTGTTEEERKGLRGLHGELFTDVSEMCLYYDIDEELYLSRIRSGMSKEEALVTKDNADIRNWVLSLNDGTQLSLMRKFKPDLTRLEFREIERNRKLAGKSMDIRKWSAEEIVQFKEGSKFENKADQVTDWSGRVFPSLKEMCRCYCISVDEFNRRRGLGWDLASTLLINEKNRRRCVRKKFMFHKKDCCDHLGILYPSKKALSTFWGVDVWYLEDRMSKGATLTECLMGTADEKLGLPNKMYFKLDKRSKKSD